jgi:hypothetical protein
VVLPAFHTRIALKNRDFVDRIGVTAVETFAPADMDVEPGFDPLSMPPKHWDSGGPVEKPLPH